MRPAARRTEPLARLAPSALATIMMASACFDEGTRWFRPDPPPPPCSPGALRCTTDLERCEAGPQGIDWIVLDDCSASGQVCPPSLLGCTDCVPGATACDEQSVIMCGADGFAAAVVDQCDTTSGFACRTGSCAALCQVAREERSNVGCEYWAVDLDNANIDATKNAAGQQFAVVVSNPQPDVPATVHVFQNEGAPGTPSPPLLVAEVVIAPLNLRVLKLGPREVDGSPDGSFDAGTHTALTRHGYRITSDFPVVAYQFNPLENVNVFSNDASLLKPREALASGSSELTLAYVVAGWPQTIAITDDPATNFSPNSPINLRAFLAIAATTDGTHVRIRPTTSVVAGGPVPATAIGGVIDVDLDAFDVLNLETADFNADFTGSLVEADAAIAVFTGSEASDAPHFATLADRRCCADHLEEQLDPIRTAGKQFALAHSPSRTAAVALAGAELGVVPEPEYFRFVATRSGDTTVTTTLPPPHDLFILHGLGAFHEVTATRDFLAEANGPIHDVQVLASQDAAGVPRTLPGGDPSIVVVPPREQFRPDYVFLTPDKYAFDFITIVAPPGTSLFFDDQPLTGCEVVAADGLTFAERGFVEPELDVHRCQLGFPTVDPSDGTVSPGQQNDGVHRLVASQAVGLVVSGFDSFVSYAYAGGTELREIAPPE